MELKSLVEERRLPFKIDKLTRGNGSCWMISVFQQCKRPEINLYLPDDIRSLVDNMDTNGLRIAVCDFMLTSNHQKVKTFKERYETLDGSELPWEQLWGFGNRGMKNSAVWADQNFMQGTAKKGLLNILTSSFCVFQSSCVAVVFRIKWLTGNKSVADS